MYNLEVLCEFFEIPFDEKFFQHIFDVLKKVVHFDYGCISYGSQKYSFGIEKNDKLTEELKVNGIKFGEILISSDGFTNDDKIIFKISSSIIANIIKDNEISKIMKIHVLELQKGYKEVKDSEKLKSDFISHISHELRTPLNSIIGYTDILPLAGDLNDKQIEFVNDIKVSGINLLNMINEILDIAKIEAGAICLTKSIFNISKLVNEVENVIKPLLKGRKFIKNIENIEICADYQKLQQILINLLGNAIKFTDNDGKIILDIHKSNNTLTISVEDNGIGIAQENIEKIFEKFEKVDSNNANSTGLGLSIVKEFVKLHGGIISVKSQLGFGTKFVIELEV